MCIIALFFHLLWIFRSDDVLFAGVEEEWRWVTSRTNNQQIHFPNTKISFLEAGYIIGRQRNHSFRDANFTKIEEKSCFQKEIFVIGKWICWLFIRLVTQILFLSANTHNIYMVTCSLHSNITTMH